MSNELYHFTLKKESDLWDCISESYFKGTPKKLERKDIFDWCVKESFKTAPYLGALSSSPRQYGFYLPRYKRIYDRYFSKEMRLEDYLADRVKTRFIPIQSGKSISGNEFSSGKFYSVASSCRFAVASFTKKKDGKLDYIESINEKNLLEVPEFEHDTPITGIEKGKHCPQLDFFFKIETGTYFIEVKNHEIMDCHKSIKLSSSYFSTVAFKKLGFKGKIGTPDSEGKIHLLASDFGCNLQTFHFDFKQFLCHLMGIWSYAQNNPSEEIYFYYLIYRNRVYEENYGGDLYKELEEEMKIIFEVFGKKFPKIHFGLCYNDKYDTLRELKIVSVG